MLAAAGGAAAQDDSPHDLSIESQPLKEALKDFAQQSGLQIVFFTDLAAGLKAPAIKGRYTADEALKELLKGTRLTYRHINSNTVEVSDADTGKISQDARQIDSVTPSQALPGQRSDQADVQDPKSARVRLAQASQDARSAALDAPTNNSTGSSEKAALEEIVVTAQKREERLQDVPVAVTALSAQGLSDNHQLLIRDYASTVPGLNISPAPSTGGQQEIAIRGISTGFNGNPTVGITIDDVPIGSSVNFLGNVVPDMDPSNLARIEVLRGPQGTLYGASSMGGLIKFVTLDPSTERVSGHVEADIDSVHNGAQPGYGFRGTANLPLTETLAVRVSGFTREDAGYIDNVVSHVDGVNKDSAYGGLITARWRPSEVFSAKIDALYQDIKANGSYEVDLLPGLGPLQQNYVPGLGGYDRQIQLYSATMNGAIGNLAITSISAYNISKYRNSLDFSFALSDQFQQNFGASGVGLYNEGTTEKFSQEVRASIPIGQRIEWLVGGFYTHENGKLIQDFASLDPITGALVESGVAHAPQPVTVEEYAAFTDLTVHITDRFSIQAGGRESHIAVDEPQSTWTGPYVGGTLVNPKLTSSANAFTYLLTPQLRMSEDLMLYARLASGYRAGGPNFSISSGSPLFDPAEPRQFDPDKTYNYEIGAKGDVLNHTLSFDASLYYIDWRNIQINLQDPINKGTYTTNGSRAKSEGVELSVESRPVTGLTIAAWVTYDDAVLTEGFPSTSTVYGVAGNRLPFTSRFSGNISLDQNFPLVGDLTGFGGITVSYVGDRQGTFLPSAQRPVYPAYARTDLRAGIKYAQWTANLFATNVTDKRGLLGGGPGEAQPYAFIYIQPRTIGLSISRSF